MGVLEYPSTGSVAGPSRAYSERYNILPDNVIGEEIRIEQGYTMNRLSQLIVYTPIEKKGRSICIVKYSAHCRREILPPIAVHKS